MPANAAPANIGAIQTTGRAQPELRQQLRRRLRSCTQAIVQTRVIRVTKRLSKFVWYGKEKEEKKVVLHKSLPLAIWHCWIHIVPLSATATLAFLNLNGLFIGAQLQGLNGSVYQTLDVLCLQVTAKLIVIFLSPMLLSPSDSLRIRSC